MNESREKGIDTLYPRGRHSFRHTASGPRTLLKPLSWIYGGSIGFLRARAARTAAPDLPGTTVISIGNIEVGGTGKTPFALYLIEQLIESGYTPLYLSRGYRSVAEHLDAVTIVLPRNMDRCPSPVPGVRLLNRDGGYLHREIGDEGAVAALRLPDVPLLFSKHKRRAIEIARKLFLPTHVVMDDAFQSWGVHRDIDIVLLDPATPFGNGWVLPAGTLREKPAALRRAHLVGCLGEVAPDMRRLVEEARTVNGAQRPFFTGRRQITFMDSAGDAITPPAGPAAAITAIARPARFEAMLEERGCELACSLRYPDHYRYTQEDIDYIRKALDSKSISTAIVTEKDWVKLDRYDLDPILPVFTRMDIVIDDPALIDAIQKPRPGAAVFV